MALVPSAEVLPYLNQVNHAVVSGIALRAQARAIRHRD